MRTRLMRLFTLRKGKCLEPGYRTGRVRVLDGAVGLSLSRHHT